MSPKLLPLQVLLEEELFAKLDEWRVRHMPFKSRSQAIARLVEMGMDQKEPD